MCIAEVLTREICVAHENMSAFKRKRGGPNQANKKGKKIKIVTDSGNEPVEAEPQKQNEVTLPPPVSMVSTPFVSRVAVDLGLLWLAMHMNTVFL